MTITQLYQLFLESNGVCTDTRNIKKDSIFFALKGENFNGNSFSEKALNNGASYAIIDEEKYNSSKKHILVDNVLTTLQNLATYHRQQLNTPIIALTGSNGKTTTKELINCVLSSSYHTTATAGNLNNHIGVPLTLLSMTEKTEIGIVEMGANHPKEIEFLCEIIQPNYGYITNIGKAHLEGFGNLEGVLKSKTELYNYLHKNNGLIFINIDDTKLTQASTGTNTYSFSIHTESDLTIQLSKADPMVSVSFNNTNVQSNLIGTYNLPNIAAAIAIGTYFKIPSDLIKNAIESYIPTNNRSQIIKKNNHTVILDAYNANPSSMHAAIMNFEQLKANSKTVFLGDMFELGNEAASEHQKITDLITNTTINQIFLLGENFINTTTKDTRIQKFDSFEEFTKNWTINLTAETTILIKGSRGMKLERILDLL